MEVNSDCGRVSEYCAGRTKVRDDPSNVTTEATQVTQKRINVVFIPLTIDLVRFGLLKWLRIDSASEGASHLPFGCPPPKPDSGASLLIRPSGFEGSNNSHDLRFHGSFSLTLLSGPSLSRVCAIRPVLSLQPSQFSRLKVNCTPKDVVSERSSAAST